MVTNLLWNVYRKSWVPDPLVYFLMTLSDPNPGSKVTGYLKVEYLTDGARVFNCTKHSCRSLGALPKMCKKLWVVAIFLLKRWKMIYTGDEN